VGNEIVNFVQHDCNPENIKIKKKRLQLSVIWVVIDGVNCPEIEIDAFF
jgi:hypothetical protein